MTDTADELIQATGDSLWSPETLQQVRDRLDYIENHECNCVEGPHENALHDLVHDDVPVLLRVIERLSPRRIETAAELAALPPETIVKTEGGTIACRHYSGVGVVFGDDRPFEWSAMETELPAIVLWSPEASR